ncbi:DMT family transporter [Anaerofustis stercorihominis]|uniref:DMT family transporter n=1 Tax=Anaerofustis stercorihominis TaxID=214853 RepID=UPI0011074D0A|nr:DMT family transporter [Anaerofustis stercorihominis]
MKEELNIKRGIAFAIFAASLYAINAPFSKILLDYIPSTLMAGFLYLGAGIGMFFIFIIRKIKNTQIKELKLTKDELPYTIAMIVLDIAAPICLLFGLRLTTAANTSLLNNFEIVATAIIAFMVFKEKISIRLWFGIFFVSLSCGILSFEDVSSIKFSYGSLFVLLAAICWGFENNCTRKISLKDPLQIVLLKGIFSGLGSVIIGLCIGEKVEVGINIIAVLFLGFVAYGLSIYFYVFAQRLLGAARTSAYYAVAPFISAIISLIIFRDFPDIRYFIALFIMAIGAWLSSKDE